MDLFTHNALQLTVTKSHSSAHSNQKSLLGSLQPKVTLQLTPTNSHSSAHSNQQSLFSSLQPKVTLKAELLHTCTNNWLPTLLLPVLMPLSHDDWSPSLSLVLIFLGEDPPPPLPPPSCPSSAASLADAGLSNHRWFIPPLVRVGVGEGGCIGFP